jgi:hypothetical protein
MSFCPPLFDGGLNQPAAPAPRGSSARPIRKLRYHNKNHTAFVTRLPPDADERTLAQAFGEFGMVVGVYIERNEAGDSMNFAFVELDSEEHAVRAVREMDRRIIKGPVPHVAARCITVDHVRGSRASQLMGERGNAQVVGERSGSGQESLARHPPAPAAAPTLSPYMRASQGEPVGGEGGRLPDPQSAEQRPPDSYGRAPESYGRHPDSYGRGPESYGRHSDSHGRGPELYGRYPDSHGRGPELYGRYPDSYGRGPESYGRYPDSYGRGPESYGRYPDSYGRAPELHGRYPDSYGRAPESYGRHPDSYGRAPESYGRYPDSYGRGPESAAAPYGRHPDSYGRYPDSATSPYGRHPDPHGHYPDSHGRTQDSYGRAPESYSRPPEYHGRPGQPYGRAPDSHDRYPDSQGRPAESYGRAPESLYPDYRAPASGGALRVPAEGPSPAAAPEQPAAPYDPESPSMADSPPYSPNTPPHSADQPPPASLPPSRMQALDLLASMLQGAQVAGPSLQAGQADEEGVAAPDLSPSGWQEHLDGPPEDEVFLREDVGRE